MTRTLTLTLAIALLGACTGRTEGDDADSGAPIDSGTDAGTLVVDSGTDGGDTDTPDAGDCELDCVALPPECHYEGRDCATESCGEIVCPNPNRMCGSLFHGRCASDEYCDFYIEGACGALDEVGLCRDRPTECDEEPEQRVCACNGTTYDNPCEAHRAGFEIVMEGECPPPNVCNGDDAWGEGEGCTTELGWKWDGNRCAPVVGCTCTGTFCPSLFASRDACRAGSETCIAHRCQAQDAVAVTTGCAEPASIGWRWDGTTCVELVGCSCDGTSCWRVEGTDEAGCQSEYVVDCEPIPAPR
ncbi:hypothetical protein [Sandaracinus amylolyticus]|uniref:hypothetical protein n=1 Tax=Sandaracinus amylolyticus TaxID=927083 RepID=UPI001F2E0DB7|nr:hypothetical protein [Sandaracinus amylolyticus]UJR82764.1 Hypothetical protein I5071_48290 [Sandaracinus amylolyticus]